MKALEMFSNYRIGRYTLKVRIAKPLNNGNTVQLSNKNGKSDYNNNADFSADESEYRSVSVRSVDSKPATKTQNGSVSGDDDVYARPTARQRGSEVTRPYARRLLTRRNSQASQQSVQSDLPSRKQASIAGSSTADKSGK